MALSLIEISRQHRRRLGFQSFVLAFLCERKKEENSDIWLGQFSIVHVPDIGKKEDDQQLIFIISLSQVFKSIFGRFQLTAISLLGIIWVDFDNLLLSKASEVNFCGGKTKTCIKCPEKVAVKSLLSKTCLKTPPLRT